MSKKDFFKAVQLSTAIVTVEGFGDVELHELTLKQRLGLSGIAGEDEDISRAKVVIMCCDMFDDDDLEALRAIKSDVLLTLFTKAMELSGVGVKKT